MNKVNKSKVYNEVVEDTGACFLIIGKEKFTDEKIRTLFENDIGLKMNWQQKGLPRENFSHGIQVWMWQNSGSEYQELNKARKHFVFWMPHYLEASREAKQRNHATTFKNNKQRDSKSAVAKSSGAYAILNDLESECGVNVG